MRLRGMISAVLLMASAAVAAAAPQLVWLNTVHDFGAFDEDLHHVKCTFRAVNVSGAPVAVISARANCGCTVPSYQRTPVAPGDTLKVEVDFNAVGRPGRFAKKVYINSSDSVQSVLTVKGTVVAGSQTIEGRYPVKVGACHLSSKVIPFGTTVKGRTLMGGLHLYNATGHPVTPRIAGLPDYMTASWAPATVPHGQQANLTLKASTGAQPEWGTVTGSFLLLPDPDGAPADSMRVSTVMIVNENFSGLTESQRAAAADAKLSTDKIDFDRISGNKPVESSFSITNIGHSPLIIRRVETAEKALSVDIPSGAIAPGGSATVRVTLNPALLAADTPLNARINLMFNSPATPRASVRVVGIY